MHKLGYKRPGLAALRNQSKMCSVDTKDNIETVMEEAEVKDKAESRKVGVLDEITKVIIRDHASSVTLHKVVRSLMKIGLYVIVVSPS